MANTLDMSTTDSYALVVMATDAGTPPDSATVTINVIVWDFDCSSAGTATFSLLTLAMAACVAVLKVF